jgi:uncharacterized protein
MRRSAQHLPLSGYVVVALALMSLAFAQPPRSYTIATASTGGTFYPVGVGLAALWSERLHDKNVRVSAISSAGSAENIAMLRFQEVELGIIGAYFGRIAYHGIEEYEGAPPLRELRSLMSLWPNVEQWVMRADRVESKTVADLIGKRVNVGRPGSGAELYSLHTLRGLGIEDQVRLEYVGFFEAIDLMRDRRIDGANFGGGPPIAAVTEAYTTMGAGGVAMLEITDEQLQRLIDYSPMPIYRYVLQANTYPGQTEPVRTAAQVTFLALHADLEDEVVYAMTKAVYESLDDLAGVHAIMAAIRLETALDGLPVPLHAGAYDYYLERGLDIPEELIPPERRSERR